MDRVILHSDCNNFYASVECMMDSSLRDKFVAVGGDVKERHGIILAKNDAAKRMGVTTGEAIWLAKLKCPDLVVVPPHFDKYSEVSQAAREIYHDNTNQVEPFGLDEAWLDVTGEDGEQAAHRIRNRIKKELGVTVSVGVSFNKVFAKLGSDYKKPDAVTVIDRSNYKDIAWSLPAKDLLYVGPSTSERLYRIGIRTIGELATYPVQFLTNRFGKSGMMLHRYANGDDHSPVAEFGTVPPVKSVSNSTTPARDMVCRDDALRILEVICDEVGRRLRAQNLVGRRVSVYMRTNDLLKSVRQETLDFYTDDTRTLVKTAIGVVDAEHDWRIPLRSVGVGVSMLTPAGGTSEQFDLFCDHKKIEAQHRLTAASDALKKKYGANILAPARVFMTY